MLHFSHSGDVGDIIYALPAIRAMGGGSLTLFHKPGETAHGMTEQKAERIFSLVAKQPYIRECQWRGNGWIDHNPLNSFRGHRSAGNLADMHLATQGLDYTHRTRKWLQVEPEHVADVIINRTPRYQNPNFSWTDALACYEGRVAFVGCPQEHGEFCAQFGEVPYHHAPNLLTLAQAIAGSKLFIGNYSCAAAIAEGLKHPMVIEVCPDHNHQLAIFQRMGCILGWDRRVEWPDL